MRITLDPGSVADYSTFLKVKRLPKYNVVGRTVIFPDEYAAQLGLKKERRKTSGYKPPSWLFDYQRDIAAMAIQKRKYSVFADCGLGKTLILLEFAKHVSETHKRGRCLIVSPLMVVRQTVAEAERFYKGKLPITVIKSSELGEWLKTGRGIGITNYEAITEDIPDNVALSGLILDESSMLKSHYGAWGTRLIAMGRGVEYKLCLTGTPAPNDRIEYANHAVFMDAFPTVNSFLARFFVNRGETSERWELKAHALHSFYTALSHWCIFLTNPAVYGWEDNCGQLPPIHIHVEEVPLTKAQRDIFMEEHKALFVNEAGGIGSRGNIARLGKGFHKGERVESNKTAHIQKLVRSWPDESTIVWCKYNQEQEDIAAALPECQNIDGTTPVEKRLDIIEWFKGNICQCELSRRGSSTAAGITDPISTSGPSDHQKNKPNTTQRGEESTPTTRACARRRGRKQETGNDPTQTSDLLKGSDPTDSHQNPSLISCANKAACAPSAAGKSRGSSVTSTTATPRDGFAESSVTTATTASGSLETAPNCSSKRPCTCGGIKPGRILVSKPRILGFGLNLQICTRQVFSGLQDSYEEFYQAVKRSNRYGSTRPLNVHIPVTEYERPMIETVLSKANRVQKDTEEQERIFREHASIK